LFYISTARHLIKRKFALNPSEYPPFRTGLERSRDLTDENNAAPVTFLCFFPKMKHPNNRKSLCEISNIALQYNLMINQLLISKQ
jgi:hypothetical protein